MKAALLQPTPLVEEAPPQSPLAAEAALILAPVEEDFAPLIAAFDEDSPPQFAPSPPDWIAPPSSDEEFGLPHPSEEPGTVFITVPGAPTILSPSPEDFAGSLPLEEDVTAILLSSAVWLAPITIDEEFASPHFDEDSPPPYVLIVSSDSIRIAVVDEDFAGSLPLEEDVPLILAQRESWISPLVVAEDYVAPRVVEEPPYVQIVSVEALTTAVVFDEEFAGSLPFEEDVPFLFNAPPTWISPFVVDEEFAGSLPLEEDTVAPLITSAPQPLITVSFDEEPGFSHLAEDEPPLLPLFVLPPALFIAPADEVIPVPPIPPPPPPPIPPPRPRPPTPPEIGGGNNWAYALVLPPICPPGHRRLWDKEKQTWICVPIDTVDYALLPLNQADVKALADGVVDVFVDKKNLLVVRLTADDGTTYYYAKVERVKKGRVKKGDVIGRATDVAAAPKALGSGAAPPAEEKTSSQPPPPSVQAKETEPAIFGVLPIAKPTIKWTPAESTSTLPLGWDLSRPLLLPEPPKLAALPPPKSNVVRNITIGVVVVTFVLGIMWYANRPPAPKRKKRSKKRRRR